VSSAAVVTQYLEELIMHDLDRISLENEFAAYENEGGYGESEADEFGYEFEDEDAYEYGDEMEGGYDEFEAAGGDLESSYDEFESGGFGYELEGENEFENDYEFAGGTSYEAPTESESPFSEAEEMELASELLNSANEEELEEFIGGLLKKAGSALGKFLTSDAGKQLAGIFKGAAKTALPILGGAAGNFLIPGAGGAMGSKLASAAGSLFGLELEGLSYEDQEFEVARQLVRFGGAAAANAAELQGTIQPAEAATAGAVTAAKTYAPGLLRASVGGQMSSRHHPRPRSGRWVRRGGRIMLLGV
jgi:hypothetical protein